MGKYDDILAQFPGSPSQPIKSTGKYDDILAGFKKPDQDTASTPTDNRRLDQKIADPIENILRFIDNPGGRLGNANVMGPQGDELFNRAGTGITEALGRRGVNPYIAAIPGTIVSMANPENWITPKVGLMEILGPKVPQARQSAVAAAKELNIPLSRAEQTGSRFQAGSEVLLEKTPTGSIPIGKFREAQMAAKEAALRRAGEDIGTSSDLYTQGQKAQAEMQKRANAMNERRGQMFDAVPDVNIPLKKSVSIADTILGEQSKFLPVTRNSEVIAFAKAIQDAEKGISSGKGVTGGPDVRGVTAPSENYGVEYGVSPETNFAPKSNYQLLKRLRETLGGKIEEAKAAKNYSAMRDFTRLKAGVDGDIETFVSSQTKPLENMVANEFSETYRKANAFSGAYKNLFDSDQAKALSEAPPEKVVGMVFKKNNETGIKQFRALVGEDGFHPAKSRFTQDLLESRNIKSELNKYEDGTLNAIYSPVELEKLRKLGDAFDLIKSAEKTSGNPSGTARQNIGYGMYTAAATALFSGHPAVAAAILGLPYASAKALVRSARGVTIPASVSRGALAIKGEIGTERR